MVIDSELKFDEHISTKVNKANSLVGLIRRSFSFLDCELFKILYTCFVRPHLEYCQAVWSPNLLKNIDLLENVQIRATKLVDGLSNLDYTERLKRLDLPTLVHRRRKGDMIEVYKHFNSYDKSILSPSFYPRERPSRQHRYQLHVPKSNDGIRGAQSNSFYHRVAATWNNLPKNVAEAENINSFKNALDKLWQDDPSMYDHLHVRRQNENEEK